MSNTLLRETTYTIIDLERRREGGVEGGREGEGREGRRRREGLSEGGMESSL